MRVLLLKAIAALTSYPFGYGQLSYTVGAAFSRDFLQSKG